MVIAHLGIGLLIIGITGSSIWQKEKIVKMQVNDETTIHKYNVILNEVNNSQGPNYFALQRKFLVYDSKNNIVTVLNPENRYYPITNNTTTEASIHVNLIRDLYIVLGDGNKNEGWIVRIYYNPLVVWIWIGALTIFAGGLVSIRNNLKYAKLINV